VSSERTLNVKAIDHRLLDELSSTARKSPRLRAHHNFHDNLDEPCQRLVIAMEPGSYLQPHRHWVHAKPELFIVLRGLVVVLLFSDAGDITDSHALSPDGDTLGFEVPPGMWHTAVSLKEGSAFMEVKPGPYQPIAPEDQAAWAPAEGDSGAGRYLEKIAAEARRLCGI
jgi:cupin fold WbuC family metalloprotein